MNNSYKFFSNTDCEYFPCHKTDNPENFSCMFCYCPLYPQSECPGTPEYLPNGIKDCTNCSFPHYNYDTVIELLRKEVSNVKFLLRVVQCKECQHFERDSWATVNGVPLIVAHEICNFWGNGCKTDPEGYCFAGKKKGGDKHE